MRKDMWDIKIVLCLFPMCLFFFNVFFLREFLTYLQRYKSFFAALPEMLCEGENVVDDSTCWSGDDVVER